MRLAAIISFIVLLSCSHRKSQEVPAIKPIKIVFLPSFLFASEVCFREEDRPTVIIKVTKRNEGDSIETVHEKTYYITKEERSALLKGIDNFNQQYSEPQSGLGLDGISVFVVSERLKSNDTIEFWSPRREGSDNVYYELLDPVFAMMKKYMTADAEMMYVEQLEQYFDYGVPIRKTGINEFRIYGALSYFEHVTKAINSLIDDVPAGESVVIDMSNFEGMGTIYYPHFKKLLAKNNQIKWIVNERARQQLLEIGWPESNLEQSTKKNFWELP